MKSITITDFCKRASYFITEVEYGKILVLVRRGKPVVQIMPFSDKAQRTPSWRLPGLRLQIKGSDLSSAITEERKVNSG
jgi:antitoxin (DNA-binding transcriptional repressor) of toxin-antitoxin stability system